MFCKNCGTQNEEGVIFCANCGSALQEQVSGSVTTEPKKKSPKFIIAAVGAVIVIVILAWFFATDGKFVESKESAEEKEETSKEIVNKYFKAFEEEEAGKMLGYLLPKDIKKKYFIEELGYNKDIYLDVKNVDLQEGGFLIDEFEWEINEMENLENLDKLEDELENMYYDFSDLEEFQYYMDDRYGEYGLNASKIKEVYVVEVKINAVILGDRETDKIIDFVYKYKGKWYIMNGFDLFW